MTILWHDSRNWRNYSRNRLLLPLFIGLLLICTGNLRAQNPPTGTQHIATLTWQAPSPVGGSGTIKGYNVYRAASGVSYSKLNASPITGLTTQDATVVSGTTYGYCATTVDSAGNESPCTVPVSATVPTNPNIPTGLAVAVQ